MTEAAAEKAPTSPAESVICYGVEVSSRWQKQHEICDGCRLVSGLAPSIRGPIAAVFCNSRHGADWWIRLHPDYSSPDCAREVGDAVTAWLAEHLGGFNGVDIQAPDFSVILSYAPGWPIPTE